MGRFQFIISFLFFTLFSFTDNALAYIPRRGNVHAILGPYIFKTNYEGEGAVASDSGGISLVILGDVNARGGLEITTTFMNKMYFRKQDGMLFSEKAQLVHVGIGYRHWWDHTWASSIVLYSSYPMAGAVTVHNDFPPGAEPTTTADENTETGLDFGIQKEIWSHKRFGVMVEGRYSWAITHKSDEYADQYGIFLGVRYFIQGKDAAAERENGKTD